MTEPVLAATAGKRSFGHAQMTNNEVWQLAAHEPVKLLSPAYPDHLCFVGADFQPVAGHPCIGMLKPLTNSWMDIDKDASGMLM